MTRPLNSPNEVTRITREVFNLAFEQLGGVPALVRWANGLEGTCTTAKNGNNLKHFYTLFAKVLPKEIKTEDVNRTHEQFVEFMKLQDDQKKLDEGKPATLLLESKDKS